MLAGWVAGLVAGLMGGHLSHQGSHQPHHPPSYKPDNLATNPAGNRGTKPPTTEVPHPPTSPLSISVRHACLGACCDRGGVGVKRNCNPHKRPWGCRGVGWGGGGTPPHWVGGFPIPNCLPGPDPKSSNPIFSLQPRSHRMQQGLPPKHTAQWHMGAHIRLVDDDT